MGLSWRSRQSASHNSWPAGQIIHKWRYEGPNRSEPWITEYEGSAGSYPDSSSIQNTGSESHPKAPDGTYRSGGPFYTSKSVATYPTKGGVDIDYIRVINGELSEHHHWKGGRTLYPLPFLEEFNGASVKPRSKDLSDLDAIGTEAISACSPANPASEVGTGVSEMYREGLPHLPGSQTWRSRTGIAKDAGQEYLNYEFGWAPLEKEVKDFASIVRRHRDILNQYSRNAGSLVHRRYNFPLSSSEDSEVIGEGRCSADTLTNGAWAQTGPGKVTITRGSRTKRWFSGAFTYDVPSQSDSWRKALGYGSDADILFGASLNPELLWNLTPWSWAVDWFSNTGDIINNISNYVRAGQVMQYGYMMEESESFVEMSMSSSGYRGMDAPAPLKKFSSTKVRQPASPYGFGIDLGSLSPTQIAITVALGITLL